MIQTCIVQFSDAQDLEGKVRNIAQKWDVSNADNPIRISVIVTQMTVAVKGLGRAVGYALIIGQRVSA